MSLRMFAWWLAGFLVLASLARSQEAPSEDKKQPPPAEQPPAEEPKAEVPANEEPPADEPASEDPPADEPAAKEPPADEPATEEPPADEPAAKEPPADEPAPKEDPFGKKAKSKRAKKDEPPAHPTLVSFREALKAFKLRLAELKSLAAKYKLAKEVDRPKIKEDYRALVAETEAMKQDLIKLGEEAFVAAPNQDDELVQFLASYANFEAQHDRYENALAVAERMLQSGAKNARIDALAGFAAFGLDRYEDAVKHFDVAKQGNALDVQREGALADDAQKYIDYWKAEQELRAKEAQADDLPRVKLVTAKGDLVLELFENEAPNTVANFIGLVKSGHYDGKSFHRVLANFMAQAGNNGDGSESADPGYFIECECYQENARKHFRGSLSMALPDPGRDKGNTGFFITYRATPHLNGKHTVFGRLIEGFDVLADLTRRDPADQKGQRPPDVITKAEVVRARDHEYKAKKVGE